MPVAGIRDSVLRAALLMSGVGEGLVTGAAVAGADGEPAGARDVGGAMVGVEEVLVPQPATITATIAATPIRRTLRTGAKV